MRVTYLWQNQLFLLNLQVYPPHNLHKNHHPNQDIGMDFSEEYRMAKQFFKE